MESLEYPWSSFKRCVLQYLCSISATKVTLDDIVNTRIISSAISYLGAFKTLG